MGSWTVNASLTHFRWRLDIASLLALFPLVSRSSLFLFFFELLFFFQLLLLSDHFVKSCLETFEAQKQRFDWINEALHVVLTKHIMLLCVQYLLEALLNVEFAGS